MIHRLLRILVAVVLRYLFDRDAIHVRVASLTTTISVIANTAVQSSPFGDDLKDVVDGGLLVMKKIRLSLRLSG